MKKFEHFKSNLKVLVTAENEDLSNEFIVGGIIDKFFVQFELGWKVLKELLSYEGQSISATGSPKMILKTAYTIFDFIDEDIWLGMLKRLYRGSYYKGSILEFGKIQISDTSD